MIWKRIFFVLVVSFVSLILVQTYLKPLPDMILTGSEEKVSIGGFNLQNIMQGKFQSSVEKWLRQHIGFRGLFIKTDNQVYYSIFNEFSQNLPRKVILGKNRDLFEDTYIENYNRLNVVPREKLREKAAALRRLQDILSQRKISFLFIITPSKASIFPEHIPEKYIIKTNVTKNDNYQTLLPFLKQYGVHFLDGREMFLELKGHGEKNLFPNSGIHWSFYGAYLFTVEILNRIEGIMGRHLGHMGLRDIKKSREPLSTDKDIARLSNILTTRALFSEYVYPETYPVLPAGAHRPRFLIVGSSYCWNIIYYLEINKLFSHLDFFYYFNTKYQYPGKRKSTIDKTNIDWQGGILSCDMVIIETNEIQLDEIGFSFIETALKNLDNNKY